MSAAVGLTALLWVIAAAQLVLAGVALQRDTLRRRPVVPLLLGAGATYAIGYGFELLAPTAATALTALSVQYLAIAAFPLLFVMLGHDVTRTPLLASRRLRVALAVVGVAAAALVATNASHDLFHAAPRLEERDGLELLVFEPGPAYLAYQAVAGTTFLLVSALLVASAVGRRTPGRIRWQASLTAIGALAPWSLFLAGAVGLSPNGLDLTPFGFALTGALAYVGVTYYGLADVSPIARDLVFDRMLDPVYVADTDGRLIDANEAGLTLLGELGAGEWRGRSLRDLLGSDVIATATEGEVDVRATVVERSPLRLARRSFDVRLARVRRLRGADLASAVVLRDISAYVALQETLAHLAHTDELTGIANRRHFIDLTQRVLERDQREGQPTALIILDLDQFKGVNDGYGHLTGDRLLRAVARALTAQLRPTDLLGRYGGEEFAVCLAATDARSALAAAERIRSTIAAASVDSEDGHEVAVTASIGVHVSEAAQAESLETLLARADAAQYAAKRAGGDRVAVSAS